MLLVFCASSCCKKFTRSVCGFLYTCTQEISAPLQVPLFLKQKQQICAPLQDLHSCKQKQQRPPSDFQQIQAAASLLQNAKNFSIASSVHHLILHNGYANQRFLSNLLIDVYGKCGALQDACIIFHSLQKKNVFTWNILFSVLVHHQKALQALELFNQMLAEGLVPDKFTYSTMVDACAIMDILYEGMLIHCMLSHNESKSHVVVATALINFYSKHKRMGHVKRAFDQVNEQDTVLWSAMIEAHAKQGYEKMSLHLFRQMLQERVKPDSVALIAVLGACAALCTSSWGNIFHSLTIESSYEADALVGNALVNMYGKCGNMEDGLCVFKKMHLHDVISWTAMIFTYTQAGLMQEAFQLFSTMQVHGIRPNAITFVNILSACSHEGMIEEGLFYFFLIYDSFMTPTSQHYGCLVDLLGRAGRLEEAELLLNNVEIRHSAVMWQALLSACKAHNDVEHERRVSQHIIEQEPS